MLSRYFILLMASLHLKDTASSILQNDSYDISNIIAKNAGRFQKGLNQISSNRASSVQHSINSLRGSNLHQSQHPEHVLNAQSTAPGLGISSVNQQFGIHPSINANHAKGIPHLHANDHQLNGPNFAHDPVENYQVVQHSPDIPLPHLIQSPPMLPQMLQNSISDPMLSQGLIQDFQSLGQSNNLHPRNDVNSIMYQNQQPASGVPSYILDRFQLPIPQHDPSLNGLAPLRTEHSTGFDQREVGNPYAMINSGQPSHLPNPPIGHNNFNPGPYIASHPTAYSSIPANSMSSSAFKQESSSPTLQSLIPLILNLLQDNNDYECCKQCSCSNMKNIPSGSQPTAKINCKDGRCGCKNDISLGRNTMSGTIDRYNTVNGGNRNTRKQVKVKNVKVEDSYEDYDDDDDVGEADYE